MFHKWIGALVFAAGGCLLAMFNPIATLNPLGHKVLMGLLIGVGLWIFQPQRLPFSVSACLVLMIFLVVGVEHKLVFAGFASSTIWVLIPATAFGHVLTKTGLGERVALLVIKTFKPTYLNMTFAWLLIGLILSAFTPSIVIRIAIVMPIAASCATTLKLEPGSTGNAFILLVSWAMAIIPGSGWLTGSLWGPITMGLYERVEALDGVLTSTSWMTAMALPMFVLTILIVVGLYATFRPGTLSALPRHSFAEAYTKLGPWTREEKYTTVILLLAFVLFLTEPIHGVGVVAICLGTFFAFFALGVLEPNDITQGVAWNLIIFLGGVLGFAGIFVATGVSDWIEGMLFPILRTFGKNSWMFVTVIPLVLFAWRMLDIAWMIPTTALIISLLPSIHSEFGIHPLVSSCIIIMAGNFAFMTYMQPFALIGSTLAGKQSWTSNQLLRYGFVYLVSCVVTLSLSLVYWKAIGYIE